MRLRFSDPDEFLNELRLAPPDAELVLRATVRQQVDRHTGAFQHLTVIASYLRLLRGSPDPLTVVLEAYQGENWGLEFEKSRETRERVEDLLVLLRSAAHELGLDCRPGVYEP